MLKTISTLSQLNRLLRGNPYTDPNWMALLSLANQALVTPRLAASLQQTEAPQDVLDFVAEVARRNRLRNHRLLNVIGAAAEIMNAIEVIPLILKGGAGLVRWGADWPRILSDVDLVVPAEKAAPVIEALSGAGFDIEAGASAQGAHAIASASRPEDPGQIDLHHRPPGPAALVHPLQLANGPIRRVGGGQVRVPEPHLHVYLQVIHDQFHDGGYWRGGVDLRHAWDIADLVSDGVDWLGLRALSPNPFVAHVTDVQLEACRRLTGAAIPLADQHLWVAVCVARQKLQYHVPRLRPLLAGLAIACHAADLREHRKTLRELSRAADLDGSPNNPSRSLARLQEHLHLDIAGRL